MGATKILRPIKIRKLLLKDLPRVVEIQEIITKTKAGPKKRAFLREHMQKEGDVSLVALAEGQVVGYIISEILTNSFGLDQGGWIENFGVLPQYMGQGIGRALAAHLFETYKKKKIGEIYTAVRWDSVDLLSFFKSIGFDRSNFINLYKKLEEKE
jgi:ribosomal protein S18 acetylase RimI-like enzyme